jgi:hypothetical protein
MIKVSPLLKVTIAFASALRSVIAPEIYSEKIVVQPAAFRAAICASKA